MNQTLAAIRFIVSKSTKFSPFYLLYTREPVLPVDQLLKPRQKYFGEEMHKIALQEQHRSFLLVKNNLKQSKQRQAKYANEGTQQIEFEIGDIVYYKNSRRVGKLDLKWKPYYRIIERTGPISYIIKNQLTGDTVKVHAEVLRLANIDWNVTDQNNERVMRKSTYVVPPASSDSEGCSKNTVSDSDDNVPLAELANRYRHEREHSDNEDNIPLMEMHKRLRLGEMNQTYSTNDNSDVSISSKEVNSSTDGYMSVDEISVPKVSPIKRVKRRSTEKSRKSNNVKKLLKLISDIL